MTEHMNSFPSDASQGDDAEVRALHVERPEQVTAYRAAVRETQQGMVELQIPTDAVAEKSYQPGPLGKYVMNLRVPSDYFSPN